MAPSSSSTPSRERPSQTSMTGGREHQRQQAASSNSSSSLTNSALGNPGGLAVTPGALIAQNSAAQDPQYAALEQAVNERNNLSSQNTQLWKLIEKQRSGYNQILKELERVRNERDAYRAKLGLGGRSNRSRERVTSPEQGDLGSLEGRLKNPSDEQLPLSSARHKAPALAQRSDSLSSQTSATHAPQAQSLRSLSSSQPDTRQANYAESGQSSRAPPLQQAGYNAAFPTFFDPSLSGATDQVSSSESTQAYPTPVASSHQLSKSQPASSGGLAPPAAAPSASTSNSSLSSAVNGSAPALSRDSRISLPDEARHYIVNMVPSPVPSPRVASIPDQPQRSADPDTSNFSADLPTPTQPTIPTSKAPGSTDSHGGKGEFLDFDEEDTVEDDDSIDQETTENGPYPSSSYSDVSTNQYAASTSQNASKLAVDEFPLPPSDSSVTQAQAIQAGYQNGYSGPPRAASLPSSSDPYFNSPYSGSPEYDDLSTMPQSVSQYPGASVLESPEKRGPGSYGVVPFPTSRPTTKPAPFRALPLLPSDLPHASVVVANSFVRPNDRGKEVLSFVIQVNPGSGKDSWKVEKTHSDVLGLDQRVRSSVSKNVGRKIANLPDGKLWRDHAPAKVDYRKTILENYLQTLIRLPVKQNDEVIAFLTSDIVRETRQPVMQAGHKEGYLTKRGKNFGGWKTRYFVLSGPVLEYYDTRGGAHLGSILITGAQIGRQQRNPGPTGDDEKEYRHAFLIVEAKKGPGGSHPRHVLCAETDEDRDSWVEMLVRYFSGRYSEEPIVYGSPGTMSLPSEEPRPSISETPATPRRPVRGSSRDDISISKGNVVPVSQLPPDPNNAKLFQNPLGVDTRSQSPSKSFESGMSPSDRYPSAASADAQLARRLAEKSMQPSSFPDTSLLSNATPFQENRANSEMGHYPDMSDSSSGVGRPVQMSPEHVRQREPPTNRIPSPDKLEGKKISAPLGGAPIPAGYKFGAKDTSSSDPTSSPSDRREKAKSRSFWGFGRPNANEKMPVNTYVPRAVFGVTLEESLDVAAIASLPAVIFRCIQYLEVKKADQEEGIYRLSGSNAVIKNLRDRFNQEGDVDLVASDEFWDPHAIAGLLKTFLRELPASILTHDLHMRFLAVIDIQDPQERIRELSRLIAALPVANYSLLRALTAHLILIVQNSSVNKMTMRNVGIVFSPTLGIPAGVFSLMLGEFNRVFNVDMVDDEDETADADAEDGKDVIRRNSRHYSDTAADQLLGLTGRTLKPNTAEEAQPDSDGVSTAGEETTVESIGDEARVSSPESAGSGAKTSKAATTAAMKGLNVMTSSRGNRHSRLIGLPASPRPPGQPESPAPPSPRPP